MIISNDILNIEIFNHPQLISDHKEEIESVLNEFTKAFDINQVDLDISFCSLKEIKELNKKFRNKDSTTNVLSFPDIVFEGIRKDCIGEIIMSMDIIKNEIIDTDKTELNHLIHLIIHSMLHLLGYKHDIENDAILMERKEIEFLSKVGIPNPYK